MNRKTIKQRLLRGLLLAAAGIFGTISTASAEETIKIAYIEMLSGPMAMAGDLGLKHFRYKVDLMNEQGGILGKQIEIVPFDNKGSPQEALVNLRQAADQGISYITQGNGSHIAAALISGVERHNLRNPNKIMFLNFSAVDPALTEEQCSFWHFRFDANSEMKLEVLTNYMAKEPDIKKVFLINQDYAHGQQISKDAKRLLSQKSSDIKVVGDILHPIGKVKDFAPYIAQIKASGADSVITGNWGNDMTLLVKAAANANLNAKFYTYYAGTMGGPAAIGKAGEGRVFQVTEYHRNLPLEKNKTDYYNFTKPFDERYAPLEWYAERGATLMNMLKKAMEKAGTTDPTKVAFALESMKIDTPWGEATMRGIDHQLLQPLFISMLTKDVKYDSEGSGLGFKTVAEATAEETATPTSCVMKRPKA